jgi:hypothetical protein
MGVLAPRGDFRWSYLMKHLRLVESKRIPDDVPSVSELIEIGVNQNNPGKSQAELAREIGFLPTQTSMLSMLKNGTSRLKLGRVSKVAKVLKLNPIHLLAAALRERTSDDPDAWEFILSVINGTHDAEEAKYLDVLREAERESGIKLELTPEKAEMLKDFIRSQMFL